MESKRIIAMTVGGAKLRRVKHALVDFTELGMSFATLEAEAQRLIKAENAVPSFSTVPGYDWATCIMKNDEMCHGIPTEAKKVAAGDVITIDVGLINDGYHLDTTTTFTVGDVPAVTTEFLNIGKRSLQKAINKAQVGGTVYEVSSAMQRVVERAGFSAVYQLTGHGVGEELHMDPEIPCIAVRATKKYVFHEGQTVAIEIMYAAGDARLIEDMDGWTYRTADGSLAGMFEETVLITKNGPQVLT